MPRQWLSTKLTSLSLPRHHQREPGSGHLPLSTGHESPRSVSWLAGGKDAPRLSCPWGAVGHGGGQQEAVRGKGKEEGWSDDQGVDVSTSPENGLVQAEEDGQRPNCFQGSACSPQEAKRMPVRSTTQTQCPPHSSQVQTNVDPKENHQRCFLLPPKSSTGLSKDGLRSENLSLR